MEAGEREKVEGAVEEIEGAVENLRRVVERLERMLSTDPGFPVYCQRDPRWAGDGLGPDASGAGTIGGLGCAVTCAAMMATSVGCAVTPGELNQWLSQNSGFTTNGVGPLNLLRWEKVAMYCPLLEWRGQVSWRSRPADVARIREVLDRGPVVAEVDFDYRDLDVDQHFVVLMGFTGEDEVEIVDPWDGARVGLVARYCNPAWPAPKGKVARVVTGLRLLQAKGVEV